MITDTVRIAEADFAESEILGVGGRSLHCAEATPGVRTGCRLRDELSRFIGRQADFPVAELMNHYRSVGRSAVGTALRTTIAQICDGYPANSVLSTWLPMTIDQLDGDYASYVGLDPLRQAVQPAGEELDVARLDAMAVAAISDLATLEATAFELAPRPEQLNRARAVARLLTRLDQLAPDFVFDPTAAAEAVSALHLSRCEPARFASTVIHAASLARKSVPDAIEAAVRRTLLPTTRLHDEQMFIRCIQVFEGLYWQVANTIAVTNSAIALGDGVLAAEHLDRATARLNGVPALFRVLTSMPVNAFAVIRGYTHGRSAVQSRAYREVEHACAPREHAGRETVIGLSSDGNTLQEALLLFGHRLSGADQAAESMRRLDHAWRRMKMGHLGITMKIIGSVPGTGGTSGASYLQQAAATPLFPALVATA
ncbi:hypothetical protein ABQF34_29355 [Mycolicibacterium boenickei]